MGEVQGLQHTLEEHPFFKEMTARARNLVSDCASHKVFHDGDRILREGDPADTFYLIRRGAVAVEVHVPGKEPLVIETLNDGEILGWSWLIAPYRTQFDARAIGLVRVLSIDGRCLRGKCEEDIELGYELYRHFMPVIVSRLSSARLQMLDIYGDPGAYLAPETAGSETPTPPAKPSPNT